MTASLKGLKVAVIEDEALVSLLMEDILFDLGCEVVATAARVEEGLRLVAERAGEIDAALLDVNLAGEAAYPVAEALAAAGVPFGFATGYGSRLPEPWTERPTIQKPYVISDVRELLQTLVGDRPAV